MIYPPGIQNKGLRTVSRSTFLVHWVSGVSHCSATKHHQAGGAPHQRLAPLLGQGYGGTKGQPVTQDALVPAQQHSRSSLIHWQQPQGEASVVKLPVVNY